MLQNGRILFKNLYNEELDESVSSRGDLVVLDRGYEELIEWLLEHGFHFLHTQKEYISSQWYLVSRFKRVICTSVTIHFRSS